MSGAGHRVTTTFHELTSARNWGTSSLRSLTATQPINAAVESRLRVSCDRFAGVLDETRASRGTLYDREATLNMIVIIPTVGVEEMED